MRVILSVAAMVLVAVCGAAMVPAAEPISPYLSEASLALAILVLILSFSQLRPKASPRMLAAEPARPTLGQSGASRADAEIVHFLAMLQDKGRLVDFLMDDINPYSDAQVGAAARVVHAGCKGFCSNISGSIRYAPSKRDRRCRFQLGIRPTSIGWLVRLQDVLPSPGYSSTVVGRRIL